MFSDMLTFFDSSLLVLLNTLTVSAVVVVALTFFRSFLTGGFKFSLRVAVIGMPRSGKTTMVTIVFDKIMSGKLARAITVNGRETIDRISSNFSDIATGLNLGPTKEKDVFSYRYTYKKKLLFLKSKYDVEIADFPGEYSEGFGDANYKSASPNNLFSKNFFSWVIQADRYIFVIDSLEYLRTSDRFSFIKQTEILFKNAVYHLKQELIDSDVSKKPILVVFSKCDCFYLLDLPQDQQLIYRDPRVLKLSTNEEVVDAVKNVISEMQKEFDPLLRFFDANFENTKVIFHSSYQDISPFQNSSEDIVKFTTP